MEHTADLPLGQALESRGFTEREFLDLCGTLAVAAGIDELHAPRVAEALDAAFQKAQGRALYPVIWLEGASCSGCTESFAQLAAPGIAAVVLEMLSLDYSDMLAAGAGSSVEEAKERTIAAGGYLLIYEGAVTLAFEGHSLRAADAPGIDHLEQAARAARAVIALGSCAVNGGWMAAPPNAPQAVGVQEHLASQGIAVPVINIPGCPANPDWLLSVLVRVVMMGGVATVALDAEAKPCGLFGDAVHDNCARRGSFEAGRFAFAPGSAEAAEGACLYPLGCRGPQTKALCGITLWNSRRSWCVYADAPCIGCCDSDPAGPSWFVRNKAVNGADRRFASFDSASGEAAGFGKPVTVVSFGPRFRTSRGSDSGRS